MKIDKCSPMFIVNAVDPTVDFWKDIMGYGVLFDARPDMQYTAMAHGKKGLLDIASYDQCLKEYPEQVHALIKPPTMIQYHMTNQEGLKELLAKKRQGLEVVAGPHTTSYMHEVVFVKDAAGFLHYYARPTMPMPQGQECPEMAPAQPENDATSGMTIESSSPMFVVESLEPHIKFWRDTLGYEVGYEDAKFGYASLKNGDKDAVELLTAEAALKEYPAAARPYLQAPAMLQYTMVDTLEELLNKNKDGLKALAEPQRTSYGHTVLFLKDAADFVHVFAAKADESPAAADGNAE